MPAAHRIQMAVFLVRAMPSIVEMKYPQECTLRTLERHVTKSCNVPSMAATVTALFSLCITTHNTARQDVCNYWSV
jgi:hypothetical protein